MQRAYNAERDCQMTLVSNAPDKSQQPRQRSTTDSIACVAAPLHPKLHRIILTVMLQTDPHLSRTVVVSTKLDTRLPQFARGSDVEMFLRPPGRLLEPGMLGGCPFFT